MDDEGKVGPVNKSGRAFDVVNTNEFYMSWLSVFSEYVKRFPTLNKPCKYFMKSMKYELYIIVGYCSEVPCGGVVITSKTNLCKIDNGRGPSFVEWPMHFVRPSPTCFQKCHLHQIDTISLLILVYFNYVLDTTVTSTETTTITTENIPTTLETNATSPETTDSTPAGEFESNAVLSPSL